MNVRFLFYSHDGLGLGHTRRHLAVAGALARMEPRATILLATGAEEVVRHGLPRQVEILKLPGLRKVSNGRYSSRRLPVCPAEIRELRSRLLKAAVESFNPEVMLVDKHPFGASGELRASLRALRRRGGQAVLGFRDILDEPATVLNEWRPYGMQHRISRYYSQVLIYGEHAVFDPVAGYSFPPALAERTRFCGYVLAKESKRSLENFAWPFPPRPGRERPVVLATVGGGEDGHQTLRTFLDAAESASWQGFAVAGPMTPDAKLAELEDLARRRNVVFRSYVPHLSAMFGTVDAVVCMGGYNTVVEVVATGVPAVCVPRVTPRREQLIRAESFGRLGLLQVCHPEELSPALLRCQIERALRMSRTELRARANAALSFRGAQRAADYLMSLAAAGRSLAA